MQNNTQNVCRCCLKLVHSANAGFINVVMREMLSLLLIKLDLDASEHPLVCGTCSEVLDQIYLFKSKCLYTEDIISGYMQTNSKVSLRDILIEMENKHNIHIDEDEMVCRLCIKIPLNGSYIALGETGDGFSFIRDMMQIHLPEMDLSIIEKPIMCEVCHVQLKNYASFAANCMAVEGKIKLYCELKKISEPVDLTRVLQFIEDNALDLQNSLDKDLVIKQEDDSVMVKVEKDAENLILENHLVDSSSALEFYLKNEEIEIKPENAEMREEMEDSLPTAASDNSDRGGSLKRKKQIGEYPSKGRKYLSSDMGDMGLNKTFGCRESTFKTDRKCDLVRRMVRPKDKSEVKMHKCEISEFSSDGNTARHRGINEEFACQECTYKTDNKHNLTRHMVRHKDKSEVEMHKCEICEFETRYKSSMFKHMMRHRDPGAEREFKCDQCPYQTNFKDRLRRHNVTHSEVKMYKCENCEYEARLKRDVKQHIMVKHLDPEIEIKFKCDQCPYKTDYKQRLRNHNLIHKDKSEVKMYKCENCEYETRHQRSMSQHMVKHRDPKAEKRFKCDKCPYKTDFKSSISTHNLRHNNKSEVVMCKCENCNFETKHKSNLIPHMVMHRDAKAERRFKCDKCPYETDYKDNLRSHNLTHKDNSEVEMHKCVNCGYKTKHKSRLKLHVMRKHRDPKAEKIFKCDQCPYETNFKSHFGRHNVREHGNKLMEVVRKCAKCDFETRWATSFTRHMLMHRDATAGGKFKCDKCLYETDFRSLLNRHNRIHEDKSMVEMHKCVNCRYETKHKSNLNRHMMRKHRAPKAEKRFKCDKCPYETHIRYDLRTHLKRH